MTLKLVLESGREIELEHHEVRELYNQLGLLLVPTVNIPSFWEITSSPDLPSTIEVPPNTWTAGGIYSEGES